MCGILGYFSRNSYLPKTSDFQVALDLQEHRGPDDSDIEIQEKIILGHRRLSIIDLHEHAKQPMKSDCGRYTIVFNGEIYNFKELKGSLIEKGYEFHTSGDTEVLLNWFIEHGEKCLNELIGMFAFAIYDEKTNKVFVARDRLGIKPLYYYQDDKSFIFSSEIKSILKLKGSKFKLNKSALVSYMAFRYPIRNDTFFDGIDSLEPGTYLSVDASNIEIKRYWEFASRISEQQVDKGEEYYLNELRRILESAVKYRMIADVPVGAYLSGGVDSSAISALMSLFSDKPIKTFTIGFGEDGYNEFPYANMVASRYQTSHHEIMLGGSEYFDQMKYLTGIKDAPLSVPNEVPLYLMSKELKKHITVVLSGEGADEIFAGYGRIFRSADDLANYQRIFKKEGGYTEEEKGFLASFERRYGKIDVTDELSHFLELYAYAGIDFQKDVLSKNFAVDEYWSSLKERFSDIFSEAGDASYLNKMMYAFERIHIVGLLQRADMTTMAASVEGRVPFVDHRLVEFAFTIPEKYKLKWKDALSQKTGSFKLGSEVSEIYDIPKAVLKKACEDILPNEVLYRKKMGFPVPLDRWLGGGFISLVKEELLSEHSMSKEFINTDKVKQLIEKPEFLNNHSNALKIWMLMSFELFLKKYSEYLEIR